MIVEIFRFLYSDRKLESMLHLFKYFGVVLNDFELLRALFETINNIIFCVPGERPWWVLPTDWYSQGEFFNFVFIFKLNVTALTYELHRLCVACLAFVISSKLFYFLLIDWLFQILMVIVYFVRLIVVRVFQ